jgi:hypothetical protein
MAQVAIWRAAGRYGLLAERARAAQRAGRRRSRRLSTDSSHA